MYKLKRAILTHGGSASDPKDSDGTQSAAELGMSLLAGGRSAIDAVVHSVKFLEDDPRFNAGTGSQIRADGVTVQQDAACMVSDGTFGAVACVDGIKNPVEIARGVLYSPNILLVGDGVRLFAHQQNILVTPLDSPGAIELDQDQYANRETACDTVGAVAFDGKTFAAALSSGGLHRAAIGRVGDVPLPGCGLFCGPAGAVACTGDGEFIALKILAREVYGWLEREMSPTEAAQKSLTLLDDSVDVGIIILTSNEFAADARDGMAWSHLAEIK